MKTARDWGQALTEAMRSAPPAKKPWRYNCWASGRDENGRQD
jgi:hypothetical protein